MRCNNPNDLIHKNVIVIGNGPSGIALSYMLDGNIPYVISNSHPDEMLSARLGTCFNQTLVNQDLDYLSHGLEGRSTNPISLLLDSLTHPCADIGLEIEPLIEWRRNGVQIDHVVFGKGPPGGSWHSMDPHILTLSLGTWMALPGLKYTLRDGAEKRAFASSVAKYYEEYVKIMNLEKYFENNTIVVNIEEIHKESATINNLENIDHDSDNEWVNKIHNETTDRVKLCTQPETEETKSSCPFTNALSFLLSRGQRKLISERCCKRKLDSDKTKNVSTSDLMVQNENRCKKMNLNDRVRSVSFSCDYDRYKNTDNKHIDLSYTAGTSTRKVEKEKIEPKWLVDVYDTKTKSMKRYSCNYLVLANGASDLPNRLSISMDKRDPTWLLHDVRSLEIELELYMQYHKENPEPVLIVGAGLSAADAIIAARAKNVPVIHLFRNKSRDLSKQLPENMYPEYHKVHQMMQQEGSNYPLYTAFPEYTLTNYSETDHTVTITSKDGKDVMEINVSFAVVLIGSRPDLSFLPENFKLGVNNSFSVDAKTNPININKLRHSVNGYSNLYAIGPIAGDNFVRFLSGGALAIVSDLYKQKGCC